MLLKLIFRLHFILENVVKQYVMDAPQRKAHCRTKAMKFLSGFARNVTSASLKKSKKTFGFIPFLVLFVSILNSLIYFYHACIFNSYFRTKSLALYYDLKHSISCLSYDETNRKLVTVGPDHTMKVWNVKSIL